jgi:D-alanyl-D-alanine carboxypeptidase
MVTVDRWRRPRWTLALLVMVCLAALGAPVRAQASTAAPLALKQALDKLVADGAPGTIALQREGEQEWHVASGVGDLKTRRPIRATDRFRIGSITKGFVKVHDPIGQWRVPRAPAVDVVASGCGSSLIFSVPA